MSAVPALGAITYLMRVEVAETVGALPFHRWTPAPPTTSTAPSMAFHAPASHSRICHVALQAAENCTAQRVRYASPSALGSIPMTISVVARAAEATMCGITLTRAGR